MSMPAGNNFKFRLHVSKECYTSKPKDGKTIEAIEFEPREVTINGALQCATEGRAFCHNFFTPRKDGVITNHKGSKTEENFLSSCSVIYDMDDMSVPMLEYIESLAYKPSFAYPSYRNGLPGLGYRYRLVYVFDAEFWGAPQYKTMYDYLARVNAFAPKVKGEHGGLDRLNVAQLYYGTTATAETYNGDIIYSIGDFPDYANFITNRVEESPKEKVEKCVSIPAEVNIDPTFLWDLRHLPQRTFYHKYRDEFYPNYAPSLSTPLILDESNMFFMFPDDYVAVLHKCDRGKTVKWEPNNDRKKKMFATAHIMLFNCPTLSIENLLFNLLLEREWYYDNTDDKISNEVLIATAVNAFTKPYALNPTKHGAFKVNKEYWARLGKTPNQASKIIRGILNRRRVFSLYNPAMSIKDNLEYLHTQGVKVSYKTLRRMVTEWEKENNKKPRVPTYYTDCPLDVTNRIVDLVERNGRITIPEMAKALNVSERQMKRYINQLRGVFIDRYGDNRNGYWFVCFASGY